MLHIKKNNLAVLALSIFAELALTPTHAIATEPNPSVSDTYERFRWAIDHELKRLETGAQRATSDRLDRVGRVDLADLLQKLKVAETAGDLHLTALSRSKSQLLCYQAAKTPVTYIPAPSACESSPSGSAKANSRGICVIQVNCERPNSLFSYLWESKLSSTEIERRILSMKELPESKPIPGVASCLGKVAYNPALKKASEGCPPVSECIKENLVSGKHVRTNFALKASNLADSPAHEKPFTGASGKAQ